MKPAKDLGDSAELQVVPFDPQKAKRQIKTLQGKVAQLKEQLLLKEGQLTQSEHDYDLLRRQIGSKMESIEFRLKDEGDMVTRLEVQVERFEQLMSKVFRKERRAALVEELEKLDTGESL